jgi:hypothetical protein
MGFFLLYIPECAYICLEIVLRQLLPFIFTLSLVSVCNSDKSNANKGPIQIKEVSSHKLQLQLGVLPKKISHRFDTFFRNRQLSCHLTGSFLIAKGDLIYQNSFGKRVGRHSEEITTEDVFQIASVSKFITALCIARLCQDSVINLNDSIQQYIPDFKFNHITIRQLLTHNSGLPEYTYLTDSGWLNDTLPKTNKDAVKLLSNTQLDAYYTAGTRFDYCNSNYMMLAYIAEKATGKHFSELVTQYIKIPAGLDSMHIYNPKNKTIESYPVKGLRGDYSIIPDHQLNHIYGDKSVFINCLELFKIYKAFRKGLIINQQFMEQMLSKQIKAKENQYYGFGIRTTLLDNGEQWHYHNG